MSAALYHGYRVVNKQTFSSLTQSTHRTTSFTAVVMKGIDTLGHASRLALSSMAKSFEKWVSDWATAMKRRTCQGRTRTQLPPQARLLIYRGRLTYLHTKITAAALIPMNFTTHEMHNFPANLPFFSSTMHALFTL